MISPLDTIIGPLKTCLKGTAWYIRLILLSIHTATWYLHLIPWSPILSSVKISENLCSDAHMVPLRPWKNDDLRFSWKLVSMKLGMYIFIWKLIFITFCINFGFKNEFKILSLQGVYKNMHTPSPILSSQHELWGVLSSEKKMELRLQFKFLNFEF